MPSDSWYSPVVNSNVSSAAYRGRSWTNTLGFRTIAKKNLPVNSYWDKRYRAEQSYYAGDSRTTLSNGAFLQITPPRWKYTRDQMINYVSTYFTNAKTDALNKNPNTWNALTISALGKASDMKANLAVTFAEAGKTSDLILNRANRIYMAMRAFRRGRFKEVATQLGISRRTVHKTWLEYKYGWMPLLMETKGAAELLAQHHVGRPPHFRVASSMTYNGSYNVSGLWGTGYTTAKTAWYESSTADVTDSVVIDLEVTNEFAASMQQMGLTNPALVAWELVPYSFVFDWFISVGDYLQAVTALHGLTVKRSMQRRIYSGYASYGRPSDLKEQNATYSWFTSRETFSGPMREYHRSPFVVDTSSLYPPRRRSPFGFEKMITSLALLKTNSRSFSGIRI